MATRASSPAGEHVWRGYVREKYIGRGRSGSAALLHRATDGHRVVVKEVNLEGLSEQQRDACENEVSILRLLCHPNILVCLDSFVSGGERPVLNIVTEYCAGGTLEARLSQVRATGERLPEPLVFSWLAQLADALEHMHSKRVIHRDVKTANVFLARAPSHLVKLGDLGVSKLLATDSFADTCIGTPFYLSPEVVRGEPYGRSSDVWSLGVVLYEMLALERPFTGENLAQLSYRICENQFAPLPAPVRAHYSPQLCNLVRGMLRKEASTRINLADFLASELVLSKLPRMVGIDDGQLYAAPRAAAAAAAALGSGAFGSRVLALPGSPTLGKRVSSVSSDWPSAASTNSGTSSPLTRAGSIRGRMRRLLSARAVLGGGGGGGGLSSGSTDEESASWAVRSSHASLVASQDASAAPTATASPRGSVAARVRVYRAEPSGSFDETSDAADGALLPGAVSPSVSPARAQPRRALQPVARSSTALADSIITAASAARDGGAGARARDSGALADPVLVAVRGSAGGRGAPAPLELSSWPDSPAPPSALALAAAGSSLLSVEQPAGSPAASELSGASDGSPTTGASGSTVRAGVHESAREAEMCRRHTRLLRVLAEHARSARASRADLEHVLGPHLRADVRLEGGGAHAAGVGLTGRPHAIATLDWLARALSGAELSFDAPTLASNARETVALLTARLPPESARALTPTRMRAREQLLQTKRGRSGGDDGGDDDDDDDDDGGVGHRARSHAAASSADADAAEDSDGGGGELLRIGTKLRWDGVRVQRVLLVLGRSEGMRLASDDSRIKVTGGAAVLHDAGAALTPALSPIKSPDRSARARAMRSPARGGGGGAGGIAPAHGGNGARAVRMIASLSHGLSQLMRTVSEQAGAHAGGARPPSSPTRFAVAPADSTAGSAAESSAHGRAPSPPRLRRPAVFPAPVLHVRVLSARRLNNINALRASINPYVTLRVGDTKHRTPTVRGSTSPDWSSATRTRRPSAGGTAPPPTEGYRFELPRSGAKEAMLEVTIKDRSNFGKNEWLAAYRLPVSTVPPHTGASGEYLRVTLQLPARRVRGSDAVDIAFGTELVLELKLDDMEGWWDAEEAGLNQGVAPLTLGHEASGGADALPYVHAPVATGARAPWAADQRVREVSISGADDETTELLEGGVWGAGRATAVGLQHPHDAVRVAWRTPCLPMSGRQARLWQRRSSASGTPSASPSSVVDMPPASLA